jgi:hypothetical protein
MDKIRIFICYSHIDAGSAEILRRILSDCYGFDVFLAEYTNTPSSDWYREIIRHLEECEIFLPLISSNLKQSHFANQEIGYAVKSEKIIMPIPLDSTQPFDMLYSVHRVDCGSFEEIHILRAANQVSILLLTNKKFCEYWARAADSLASALFASSSVTTTSGIVFTIERANGAILFTKEQLNIIKKSVTENPYVRESTYCPRLKVALHNYYQIDV